MARQSAAAAGLSGHPSEPVIARAVGVHPHGPPPEATVGCGDRKEDLLGMPKNNLASIRASLNPLSRFDFGILSALEHFRQWQAKERKKE